MTYSGEWGTFIHIPKTGGNWVIALLKNKFGPGQNNGEGHGLPIHWDRKPVFTLWRSPAEWLRSAWGHRNGNNWKVYNHAQIPWATFINITTPYRDDDFNKFALNLWKHEPGIVTWFFKAYAPPAVHVAWLEHPWILELMDCSMDTPPKNANPDLPIISLEVENMAFKVEHLIYERKAFWRDEKQHYVEKYLWKGTDF